MSTTGCVEWSLYVWVRNIWTTHPTSTCAIPRCAESGSIMSVPISSVRRWLRTVRHYTKFKHPVLDCFLSNELQSCKTFKLYILLVTNRFNCLQFHNSVSVIIIAMCDGSVQISEWNYMLWWVCLLLQGMAMQPVPRVLWAVLWSS